MYHTFNLVPSSNRDRKAKHLWSILKNELFFKIDGRKLNCAERKKKERKKRIFFRSKLIFHFTRQLK